MVEDRDGFIASCYDGGFGDGGLTVGVQLNQDDCFCGESVLLEEFRVVRGREVLEDYNPVLMKIRDKISPERSAYEVYLANPPRSPCRPHVYFQCRTTCRL